MKLIHWLLEHGGDGNIADSSGDLPIHYAAIGAKPEAVLTLVDKGEIYLYLQLRLEILRGIQLYVNISCVNS